MKYLLLLHLLLAGLRLSAQTPYQAGVGVANITPWASGMSGTQKPDYIVLSADIYTTGGNAAKVSAVESDLEVRALIIEDAQGQRFAFVTLDALALPDGFTADVRQRVQNPANGLNISDLVINVSHTHNAPALLDLTHNNADPDNNADLDNTSSTGIAKEAAPDPLYSSSVKDRIVLAIQQGINNLVPASLSVSSTTSDLATYRRPDAKLLAHQVYPQRVDVLQARNASGQVIAVSYFLGCHPTTMYSLSKSLSADFPGSSRQRVEARLQTTSPNAKALFFQGFGGDLEVGQQGIAAKEAAGVALGNTVADLIISPVVAPVTLSGPLSVSSRLLQMPVDTNPNWKLSVSARTMPVEVQQVQLASTTTRPWTFVFCSHEVVSEYAANVRSYYTYPGLVTVAGYSNTSSGYLPTQRMTVADPATCGLLPSGGYEGCYSFRVYGRRAPSPSPEWTDDKFYAHKGLFTDDFNDNQAEPDVWMTRTYVQDYGQISYEQQVTVCERSQHLEIRPLSNVYGPRFNGYTSVHTYDFTNEAISVELVQGPNPTTNAEFRLCVARDVYNYYIFAVQAGQLWAKRHLNGVDSVYTLSSYIPAQHRYLRLRHDQATERLLWETSSDGLIWSVQGKMLSSLPVAAMRIELTGGIGRFVEDNLGTIIVDNFRLPGSEALFTDNFNDNSQNTTKWAIGTSIHVNGNPLYSGQVSVEEQNQRLEITPRTGSHGLNYNGYSTVRSYDFTGQYASIELVQGPNPTSHAELLFYVARDTYNYYAFNVQAGQLRADKYVNGVTNYYPLGPYNPIQHRYLRIRHSQIDKEIVWETSSDGQSWHRAQAQPQEMAVTAMRIELVGGTYQYESTPGLIALDNFRVPTTLFTDDFDDNSLDQAKWTKRVTAYYNGVQLYDQRVDVSEQNQRLEITPRISSPGLNYNGYSTVRSYDFTGQYASVELVRGPNPAAKSEFFLYVTRDEYNFYAFNLQGEDLRADEHIGWSSNYWNIGKYDSTQHHYFRLRHDEIANEIVWEISSDGISWDVKKRKAVGMDITAMHIELVGGTYQPETSPGVIWLDNFRLPGKSNGARAATTPLASLAGLTVSATEFVHSSYPNPVANTVTIAYQLPQQESVIVKLYDAIGREVSTLLGSMQTAGNHAVQYDTKNLPGGVYFYRIITPTHSVGSKIVVVK